MSSTTASLRKRWLLVFLGSIETSVSSAIAVLQIAGGWSVASSLLSSLFLLLSWRAGTHLVTAMLGDRFSELLTTGIGLILGVSLSQLVHHAWVLLPTSIPSAPVWLALAVLLVVTRADTRRNTTSNHQHDSMQIAVATTSATLAALSLGRFWVLPVAIALSLVAWCWQRSNSIALVSLSAVCLGTITLGQRLLTENWWYVNGNDAQYFESISWSLARFGMFENPLSVGTSIQKYHWLIYSFSGTVSEFAGTEPWQTITLLAPGVVASAAVLIVAGFLQTASKSSAGVSLAFGALSTAFLVGTLETVTSNDFGLICLLASLALIALPSDSGRRGYSTLVLLVTLTTLYAKTTAGMGAIVLLLVAACFFISRRQAKSAASLIALAAAVTVVGWLWFSGPGGSSMLSFELLINSKRAVYEQFVEFVLHPRSAVLGSAIFVASKQRKSLDSPTAWFTLLSITLFVVGLLLQLSLNLYVVGVPLGWGVALLTVIALFVGVEYLRPVRRQLVVLLALAGTLSGWTWVWTYGEFLAAWRLRVQHAGWSSPTERFLVSLTSDFVTRLLPVLAILALAFGSLKLLKQSSKQTAALLLVPSLCFSFGASLYGARDSYQRDRSWYEEWGANSQPHAKRTLLEVADFLRLKIPRDAIVASNNFCCSGSRWLDDELRRGLNDELYLRSNWESKWGGANSLLVAHSQRRFLVQSPRFLTSYNYPSADLIERLRLSVRFANTPNMKLVGSLKSMGVSYFVVNLNQTLVRNWGRFGTVLVANRDFLLLEL